ncbi:MAG: ArsR family transcriptional regulator [Prolixibacteraceae bacterium]
MEVEKGKTVKYLKEKREVATVVKENLKEFTRIKKSILTALKESEMTVPQLAEKLKMQSSDVMYYLMTLQKYGFIATGEIDDMDEYFYYKINE